MLSPCRLVVCRWMRLAGVVQIVIGIGMSLEAKEAPQVRPRPETVGRVGANRYLTPTGQILTPAGRQVELPGMRPQALALSPDGRWLVTSGKTNGLIVIDVETGVVRQRLTLSTNKFEVKIESPLTDSDDPAVAPNNTNTNTNTTNVTNITNTTNTTSTAKTTNTTSSDSPLLSLTGLVFSPDGKRLYLSNAGRDVRVFAVDVREGLSRSVAFAVPDAKDPKQKHEIPAGLAVSADNRRLYVVGNLGNRLHELDAVTGKALRSWATGVAPFDVALAAGKAYVSNLGGRRPGKGDLTAPAGRGAKVRVDRVRHIASEGSVTVIDLGAGTVKDELLVELHASALAVSPDQKYVVVANTGSDTLSVIDTKTDQVVEKIWTRQTPSDFFGAQPNALAFDRGGKRLFVCNGTQNAVAVIQFKPDKKDSKVMGLIPVGWFPGAIEFVPGRNEIAVANIKGLGALKAFQPDDKIKLNSKDFFGTVSFVPVWSKVNLPTQTRLALQNMRYPKLAEANQPPRPNQPARPVPERVGEPALLKHVIYIIKENRTYDQVLGDMEEGDGNSELCVFGEKFTPNQHKIAREFVLLDNTYCAGVNSSDGHQWTDSAIANDYVERQLTAGSPRSYSSGKEEDGLDALSWASSGFIWDNALAHGKSFRNYGEWMLSLAGWRNKAGHKEKPKWQDFWHDFTTGSNLTRLASRPGIETLRPYSPTNTVGWDLNVPDVMRAAQFIRDLRQFEIQGRLPDFILLFLPNDHTGGTRGRSPTPGAQVADNDFAFGQIVEAVSHSQFWPETCLIAIEDDPQAGWDHVSGYRTTCYVVSPYTKRQQTVSTPYNQTGVMRTIELILGLPPMNQMDATAAAMHDCFTATPDLTPFVSVPNNIPLDQTNAEPKKITHPLLRQDAIVSASLPLEEADRCPEDVFNRILWRAMKGPETPYPEWAVKTRDDD